MKEFSYRQYEYNSFFEHYFKNNPTNSVGNNPEKIFIECKNLIPNYVDTIFNFGCANGKDFIPFQNEYNCVGFDLAPINYIEWVCKKDNLIYYQCSIEDYLDFFDHSESDLSNSLVCTQGTLMYVSYENQDKFLKHLIDHGCKNMLIHEYPPEYTGPHTKFNPSTEYLNLFVRKHFRSEIIGQPTGFLYLDTNE